MKRIHVRLAGSLVIALLVGCSDRHGGLAVDEADAGAGASASGGNGGNGGGAGSGSGGATATSSGAGGVASSSASSTSTTSGAPLPTKVTVVNGVSDYGAVRLCFERLASTAEVSPWPSEVAGLGFGLARAVDPAAVSPDGEDVRVHVIAGELALTKGKSCEAIRQLALSEPGLVVASLPILPGSAFDSGQSLLLVPTGCLGGEGHSAPGDGFGCGQGYSPTKPTVQLVALGMSRATKPGKVSLQAIHASPAIPTLDVRIAAGFEGAPTVSVASSLAFSARSAVFTRASADLAPLASVKLRTFAPSGVEPSSTTLASAVFAAGNVAEAGVLDGQAYALVLLGAAPGSTPGPTAFWRPFTFAWIAADP